MAKATKKLVYGVGINDSNYNVQKFETIGCTAEGKQIRKLVWICPFYSRWKGMLERCYSKKFQQRQPTYEGCFVIPEWYYFMAFRNWMVDQDWEGKELDKDILFPSNKVYGPDTCVFVDQKVNKFLNDHGAGRGELPIGVCFHKSATKFASFCNDLITGKRKYLGLFGSPKEAHQAWLTYKLSQAHMLAEEQTDPRIAAALISRYENYL